MGCRRSFYMGDPVAPVGAAFGIDFGIRREPWAQVWASSAISRGSRPTMPVESGLVIRQPVSVAAASLVAVYYVGMLGMIRYLAPVACWQ